MASSSTERRTPGPRLCGEMRLAHGTPLRAPRMLAPLCALLLAACGTGETTLSFTPAALRDCGPDDSTAVIEVRWDASRAEPVDGVTLWVNPKGKPRFTGFVPEPPGKPWVKAGARGMEATGPWAIPGMLVTVTDSRSGTVLARKKIPAIACD